MGGEIQDRKRHSTLIISKNLVGLIQFYIFAADFEKDNDLTLYFYGNNS